MHQHLHLSRDFLWEEGESLIRKADGFRLTLWSLEEMCNKYIWKERELVESMLGTDYVGMKIPTLLFLSPFFFSIFLLNCGLLLIGLAKTMKVRWEKSWWTSKQSCL